MESGAKGCEVVVSGKLRAARAKSMKFTVRLLRLRHARRKAKKTRPRPVWNLS
jgi:ribosomal protein S3